MMRFSLSRFHTLLSDILNIFRFGFFVGHLMTSLCADEHFSQFPGDLQRK